MQIGSTNLFTPNTPYQPSPSEPCHAQQWSNASTPNSTYGLLWDGHADFKKGLAEVAASNGGSLSRALMFVGDHQSAIQRLTQVGGG